MSKLFVFLLTIRELLAKRHNVFVAKLSIVNNRRTAIMLFMILYTYLLYLTIYFIVLRSSSYCIYFTLLYSIIGE